MATQRQKKLARAMVDNLEADTPKNAKELLVSAGYDETTAEATPGRIMEQKGGKKKFISKCVYCDAPEVVDGLCEQHHPAI